MLISFCTIPFYFLFFCCLSSFFGILLPCTSRESNFLFAAFLFSLCLGCLPKLREFVLIKNCAWMSASLLDLPTTFGLLANEHPESMFGSCICRGQLHKVADWGIALLCSLSPLQSYTASSTVLSFQGGIPMRQIPVEA